MSSLQQWIGIGCLSALLISAAWATDKVSQSPLRWAEGEPGCTFTAGDDGRYRYGLWTDEFGIVLAVDSQELQKSVRRTFPLFTIMLTVHYRGTGSLDLKPETATLEFVKHYHDRQAALDPEALAKQFQADADELAQETEREVRKHPRQAAQTQADLQDHQKVLEQTMEFLKTRALREVRLAPDNPQAEGWLIFNARSRWTANWEKQEEFVLRIPLGERTVEFPFVLPPSQRDLILRRRP